MRLVRTWMIRLEDLFNRERRDRELAEELESHLAMHIEDNLRAGASPEEARRQALIKLGGIEQTKERYRDRRGIPLLEHLVQDLRHGLRMLGKNPSFTTLVVMTLALGIGVNTAVFSVINGWLRPLPVHKPEQLIVLATQVKDDPLGIYYLSYPAYVDFRKQQEAFSDLFGYSVDVGGLTDNGQTSQSLFSYVTGNYFSALGINPAAGRLILPVEGERPNAEPVLVLGYSCWQRRFSGNPGVIGKRVLVDGRPATVVGVTPRGFRGLYSFTDMDGYLPLGMMATTGQRADRSQRWMTVLGRLKPETSLSQAQSSVNVITQRLAEHYPATDKGITVRVLPERLARPIPQVADITLVVSGLFLVLAALVLLLTCMNVANVLLVRATVRQREMAIRTALGSGRGRLLRQILTESLLLAFLGGTAGIILGNWASRLISSIRLETTLPITLDFGFDWRVFLYALAAALFTGIAVGLWPALRASRTELNVLMHETGRSNSVGVGHHRVRNFLVAAQVAGSLMLLIVAGLFIRNLERAQRMYLGFDPDHILNVVMDPHQIGYDQLRTEEFYRGIRARVRTLAGVQSVSLAYSVPMGNYNDGSAVYLEGHPLSPGQQPPFVLLNNVDWNYFKTMRIPLQRGRTFEESDNESAPLVAIVNQTMAHQFWPNQEPIGKRFSTKSAVGPFMEVVGVAQDGKYLFLFEDRLPYFYVPLAQNFTSTRVIQIRSIGMPEPLIKTVQREIQLLNPAMPILDLRTMRDSLAGTNGFFLFRFGAYLAGTMGILGLTLAVVGVYGVVSFVANQRTREIGIYMALGANRQDVLSLVLRQGVWLVLAGMLAGLAGAFAVTRLMGNLLLISASDPLTFAGVTLLLAAIALMACYVPALRATKVDPMVALRYE